MSNPWPRDAGFDPLGRRDARFLIVPEWLFRVPELPRELTLAYGLLLAFWRKHRVCNLSMDTIARRLRIDRRTAVRQIKQLEALGLIVVSRRRAGLRNLPNEYAFAPHPAASSSDASATTHGDVDATTGGDPDATRVVTRAAGGGDTQVLLGSDTGVTQEDRERRDQEDDQTGAPAPSGSVSLRSSPEEKRPANRKPPPVRNVQRRAGNGFAKKGPALASTAEAFEGHHDDLA